MNAQKAIIRLTAVAKVFPNGEVVTMLTLKSCRMLFAFAASSAMAQVTLAECNCSVPPAPAVSTGIINSPAWADGAVAVPYAGSPAFGNSPGSVSSSALGSVPYQTADYDSAGPHWAPGGYEVRTGSPAYYHDPAGGQHVVTGNPYNDHFGPGFHRNSLHGHYRFPYYNYRAPWYFPGKAVYNRNTNFAW